MTTTTKTSTTKTKNDDTNDDQILTMEMATTIRTIDNRNEQMTDHMQCQ